MNDMGCAVDPPEHGEGGRALEVIQSGDRDQILQGVKVSSLEEQAHVGGADRLSVGLPARDDDAVYAGGRERFGHDLVVEPGGPAGRLVSDVAACQRQSLRNVPEDGQIQSGMALDYGIRIF